ncbi:hypothetical protein AK830_g10496 [Neonectria ditissima]|uniref:Vps72/YL1 C-terminal domain-containing protein n=1 Tax=Neonectria ditissima TaxID=78410 RepID=A0A0P7B6Q0_9HYPO|nr:hypothetical protein AK830_g10496 [Neonectria ditissima]
MSAPRDLFPSTTKRVFLPHSSSRKNWTRRNRIRTRTRKLAFTQGHVIPPRHHHPSSKKQADDLTMEPEPKPSERDGSRSPDLSSDSDSDSDAGIGRDSTSDSQANVEPQVEWLATGRERRSTAGNRMKSMLANEEPDSDLELLFAEDENDQGFSDVDDDGSDVRMDSSSDDEDENTNNNNGDEDLEGEKELERQAKERRTAQRKRKAQEAIPAKFRKKVRINPTTTPAAPKPAARPEPRPKKKSERTSWLPSVSDLPTRASSRQTTRWSKEQLHQQMVQREAKRLKQLAQMQKKAARLEALKKPPMTQEERLREAALVEKRNSKSLNRWEVAEKQREEDRRARLAALNQRTLKGPVITFWSGIGEWMGRNMVVEEPAKKKRERIDKNKAKGKEKAKDEATEVKTEVKDAGEDVPKVDGQVDDKQTTPAATAGSENADNQKAESHQPLQHTSPQPPVETPAPTGAPKAIQTTAGASALSATPSDSTLKEGDAAVPVKVEEPSVKPSDAPTLAEKPDISKAEDPPRLMAMPPPPPRIANGLAAPAPAPSSPPDPSPPSSGLTAPSPPPSSGLAAPAPPPPPSTAPPTNGLAAPAPTSAPPDTQRSVMTPPPGLSRPPESKPSGVLAAPLLAPPPSINVNGTLPSMLGFKSGPGNSKSNVLALPNTSQASGPPTMSSMAAPGRLSPPIPLAVPAPALVPAPPKLTAAPASPTSTSIPTSTSVPPREISLQPISNPLAVPNKSATPDAAIQPPEPPKPSTGARNAIVFQNFDENAIKDRTLQTQLIFGRKMTKLGKPSHAPLCVITNHPARYRDPKTGLPYFNAYAYREIQRLCRGEHRWSKILNAWVGSGSFAARGVPERFLNPDKKRAVEDKTGTEKKADDGKVPETKPGEAKSADVKPADVKPVEVKPAGGNPPDVNTPESKLPESKLPESKPPEAKPSEVNPPEARPSEINTPEAAVFEVRPPEPTAPDVETAEPAVKAPDATPPEPKQEANPPTVQPLEVASPEAPKPAITSNLTPVASTAPTLATSNVAADQETPTDPSTTTTAEAAPVETK